VPFDLCVKELALFLERPDFNIGLGGFWAL